MAEDIEYTDPTTSTTGVTEGWAEIATDPASIDWTFRQAQALIPFSVVDGRPVKPGLQQAGRRGRNQLGKWGENAMADAIVTATYEGTRHLLLIRRGDGNGWATAGGKVDPGETPQEAARRELAEETGLHIPEDSWTYLPPRVVPDPRGSDEAWAVTLPGRVDLGSVEQLPAVRGASDAAEARWVPADTYVALVRFLELDEARVGVFAAHVDMLREALAPAARIDAGDDQEACTDA